MPNLDPNPANVLGKGILAPHIEARLLARGVIFAMYATTDDAKPQTYLVTSHRPWTQNCAVNGRDLRKFVREQRTKTPIAA